MIYEWYRGSDGSGEIPKAYTFLRLGSGKLFGPNERLRAFEELCEKERDPNYKALFLYESALILGKLGKQSEQYEKLWEAFRTFDYLLASFPHVADTYVQVCSLLVEEWVELGEPIEELERYAPAMFGALVWWDRSSLNSWDMVPCWYGLGKLFLMYAQKHEDREFGELALAFGLRLHREVTEDPKWLFFLYECYRFLDDGAHCKQVLEMLREVDRGGEYLKRAESMGFPDASR